MRYDQRRFVHVDINLIFIDIQKIAFLCQKPYPSFPTKGHAILFVRHKEKREKKTKNEPMSICKIVRTIVMREPQRKQKE